VLVAGQLVMHWVSHLVSHFGSKNAVESGKKREFLAQFKQKRLVNQWRTRLSSVGDWIRTNAGKNCSFYSDWNHYCQRPTATK